MTYSPHANDGAKITIFKLGKGDQVVLKCDNKMKKKYVTSLTQLSFYMKQQKTVVREGVNGLFHFSIVRFLKCSQCPAWALVRGRADMFCST